MLNTNGASAGGSLVSSSALLFVLAVAVVVLLSHKGVTGWFTARHTAVREHFYGPQELYETAPDDQQDPEALSDNEVSGDTDPDDGYDYSIFATDNPTPGE